MNILHDAVRQTLASQSPHTAADSLATAIADAGSSELDRRAYEVVCSQLAKFLLAEADQGVSQDGETAP